MIELLLTVPVYRGSRGRKIRISQNEISKINILAVAAPGRGGGEGDPVVF